MIILTVFHRNRVHKMHFSVVFSLVFLMLFHRKFDPKFQFGTEMMQIVVICIENSMLLLMDFHRKFVELRVLECVSVPNVRPQKQLRYRMAELSLRWRGCYVTYIHLNPAPDIKPGSSTTYIHLAGGGPPPHQLPTAEADILSQQP